MKISAVIITKNEAAHIGACIASVLAVADEVLVLDSFSTDETPAIATAHGARVMQRPFVNFGAQKNEGHRLATYNYVLSIDADERLSPALQQSILVAKQTTPVDVYVFNRLNFVGDRAVKNCGWYPDKKARLYNKTKTRWTERAVHETLIKENCREQFLVGDLLHYSYDNVAELRRRSVAYAMRGAHVYTDKNQLSLLVFMLVNPLLKFCKNYFFKSGWREGMLGLAICCEQARETFLKYYFAWRGKVTINPNSDP